MTARARARAELTEEIKRSASEQLAEVGAAQLSVRAIARDLGMASSAVYRYFPGRDELLTALIVDGYGELAAVAEAAVAECEGEEFVDRFLALARAIRRWAIERPHLYALLYGSPVPGYAAPQDTIAPAARIAGAYLSLFADAPARPAGSEGGDDVTFDRVRAAVGVDVPDEVVLAGIAAWTQLFGHLSFELFGQFVNTVEDYETFFDASMRVAATTARPAG